jgi:transcription termination/antitermination protein NusG
MQKNWYVVSAYPGYEQRANKMLERKIHAQKMENFSGDILVPTERVLELSHGVRRIVERRMFPGYILVHIALTDDVWHLIRFVPKIRGLVGRPESPTVLSESEVEEVLSRVHAAEVKPRTKVAFAMGDKIKIVDGAFRDFTGTVDEFNPERARIKVSISVFGRPTPVMLGPVQVEAA